MFHQFIQICLSYMTFMVIYYTIFYVLCSCTVFMYSFHIQFSCFTFHITFSFILTFQIILHSYTFSYIMSDLIISCYRTYHHIAILCFSDHNISYNLMFQNLSSHSSAMLLISYHIFSLVIFKSFILCFMPVNTKEVDIGNYKGSKALYSLYETVVYKGPKALLSLYETMTIYKSPKALW